MLFLLGGTIIYSDYGISIDEDNTRLNGFITLKYLFEIIAPEQVANLNEIIKLPNFEISTNQSVEQSGGTQGLGVVFDLPMALIEFIFQINDTREHYLIRHFSTFLVFLT